MTPEERAAKIVADGQWIVADYHTDESGDEYRKEEMNATLLERAIADAIRAAEVATEVATVERCSRVLAFVLEHEPHNVAALPRMLREYPEMDIHDLSGPAKDIDFPAGFEIGGEL